MISYKRVGGLHFVKIFRVGFAFYLQKKPRARAREIDQQRLNFG
jgi:hypothetical protein